METVSRNKNLNIPKVVQQEIEKVNSVVDEVATQLAFSMAEGKRFNADKATQKIEERDTDWERIQKIPETANDLIVITAVKKLGAYIIAITEKSPAKYRGVFVNRMQNYCLDTLENLLQANFIQMNSDPNKHKREDFQAEAITKLKLLGYVAMLSENAKCILTRQYKQISIQLGDAVNLIAAWRKSDDERWKMK